MSLMNVRFSNVLRPYWREAAENKYVFNRCLNATVSVAALISLGSWLLLAGQFEAQPGTDSVVLSRSWLTIGNYRFGMLNNYRKTNNMFWHDLYLSQCVLLSLFVDWLDRRWNTAVLNWQTCNSVHMYSFGSADRVSVWRQSSGVYGVVCRRPRHCQLVDNQSNDCTSV